MCSARIADLLEAHGRDDEPHDPEERVREIAGGAKLVGPDQGLADQGHGSGRGDDHQQGIERETGAWHESPRV